ncbi:hypothetical protein SAM_2051 [Streptococcus agalactiae CJB111]|nr:hypothetical protein SAM_2051 [Streptococcus agalactiae CJB111]
MIVTGLDTALALSLFTETMDNWSPAFPKELDN